MRIQLNAGQAVNTIFNAAQINKSAARQNTGGIRAAGKGADRDSAAFSLQGKLMGMVDRLTDQKQSIFDRRDELIENTLKRGGDMDDIKDQLKDYEKQLKDIDDQIEDLYAQQLKEAVSQKDKDKKKDKSDSDKSKEQLESEHLVNIACSSDGVKQTEKITAAKNRVQGDIHVKQAELEQSGREVQYLEARGMDMGPLGKMNTEDMVNTIMGTMEDKQKEISGLQDKVTQLGVSQGESMRESMEELDENAEAKEDKLEEE